MCFWNPSISRDFDILAFFRYFDPQKGELLEQKIIKIISLKKMILIWPDLRSFFEKMILIWSKII
jgi:hypothetical protein